MPRTGRLKGVPPKGRSIKKIVVVLELIETLLDFCMIDIPANATSARRRTGASSPASYSGRPANVMLAWTFNAESECEMRSIISTFIHEKPRLKQNKNLLKTVQTNKCLSHGGGYRVANRPKQHRSLPRLQYNVQ
ncbi:hypothetical protein L249_5720 [Ophiocordyceps polyrhachis-furcata BCC 54312]|uniref:Uncharacterized protein n=1 Tax=Ophiocordyceps polyrhachis-furcata BCC 54312 TaxID=1330021 RepID=A0A367L015_9HYPO|nr:hypothetical protein L249_5720 [Ophiocordyceps polyrhachis-furcata BCC 54312]